MQRQAVLKALVKRSEQADFPQQDATTKVLIAASLEILRQLAEEMQCPRFDMSDDNDKGFLLKAVSEANPEAEFDEEDRAILRLLETAGDEDEVG